MVDSDHKLVVATIADKMPRGKRKFRFDKRWIGKEGLVETISEGWHLEDNLGEGSFMDKVLNCRHAISK